MHAVACSVVVRGDTARSFAGVGAKDSQVECSEHACAEHAVADGVVIVFIKKVITALLP